MFALAACGGDDEACDPAAQTGCGDGLVCERVVEGEPACFAPLVVRGSVFDLETGDGVEGARVVALDQNRAPASSVATTDAEGEYELAVPSLRDPESGDPFAAEVTLRADAQGYQAFPSGIRRALPIDTGEAQMTDDDAWVVASALTDIGLIDLEGADRPNIIRGEVDTPDGGGGVLVVAEGGEEGYTAIADLDGGYAIFNLPDGSFSVRGYARGVNYEVAEAEVSGGEEAEVDLSITGDPASTVSGRVEFADAPGDAATSVILVVASTFDEILARGESPPGMRVPDPGVEPDVTGEFTFEGVPAGTYKVLAAFENDGLVRDPDTCIAGTDVVEAQVGVDEDVAIDQSFKITGALDVKAPGADGPRAEEVGDAPSLTWADDASEDEYDVTVVDALGNVVWETTIPGATGQDPVVEYDGPALESGMYYQFRALSKRQNGPSSVCEISQTEDLKGVFYRP